MDPQRGKIIWITGASSGIGKELALQMAQQGHTIIVSARSQDKLDALAQDAKTLSGKVFPYPCDITDEAAVSAVVADVEKNVGPIDQAVLNAGTYVQDTLATFSVEAFRTQMDVNLYGTAHCLSAIMPRFMQRKSGHLVIVSSVAGMRGLPGSLSYGPGKAALINLAEALYIEAKPYDIKVQLVNPGFIKTPLTDKNEFDMPMLMPVEKAVEAMIKGMESHKFEIVFPWLFVTLKKIIDLLPNKLYLGLMGRVRPK